MGNPGRRAKRSCPTCGRMIAETVAGVLTPHRVSGRDCAGEVGVCATCGRAGSLAPNGLMSPHRQLRVRVVRGSVAGLPAGSVESETYSSDDDCPGGGQPPEMSGPDLSGERFPTFTEVNQERWTA